MTRTIILLLLCFLLPLGCKKEAAIIKNQKQDLPDFSAVNLRKVFSAEDSQLPNRAQTVQTINEYYQRQWVANDQWGGLLIAKGDDILFEEYRGYAQEGLQQPITRQTPLHVASISKTVTAMAVMKLVEAGKINLNAEVSHYLAGFPYPGITVLQLLTQRSGLPKYEYFIDKIDPFAPELKKQYLTNTDVLNLMIRYRPALAREPDTGFMYCNTNYAMLALIVEKATKLSFPEAISRMVFLPLEMRHSYIFTQYKMQDAAKSFYNRGARVHPYDRLDLIYGDKNLYTTPRDLYRFSKALFSENFLKPDLMRMVFSPYSMEKPGVNNYGIGFRMKLYDGGQKLTFHTGWWHGTNSVFGHLLNSKVTIIAIGNKFSRVPYTALSLASLFENFPAERAKFDAAMGLEAPTSDTATVARDTVTVDE